MEIKDMLRNTMKVMPSLLTQLGEVSTECGINLHPAHPPPLSVLASVIADGDTTELGEAAMLAGPISIATLDEGHIGREYLLDDLGEMG